MEYGIISISETPGPFEPKVGWGGGGDGHSIVLLEPVQCILS